MIDINFLKLQKLELSVLKAVKDVCDKNDIKYFLYAGSLLGAIRHNGFIPWDDDIDIGMTYDEFKKFEKIANSKFDERFFLQTPMTDSQCKSYFCGRVRLEGTHFISNSLPNDWKHNGIFVDILPLVKVPTNKLIQKLYFFYFQILIRILWLRSGYNPHPSNKLFRFIMRVTYSITKPIPTKYIENKIKDYNKKYEKLENFKYMELLNAKFKGCIIEPESISTLGQHIFVDEVFSIPEKPEEFLRNYYGDWEKLPPLEEQEPHHITNIDFGIY